MPYDDFSYDNLKRLDKRDVFLITNAGKGEPEEYEAKIIASNPPFIGFWHINNPGKYIASTDIEKIIFNHELKFHISLPEGNEVLRNKGWEIIKNEVMSEGIEWFKLIRPSDRMSKQKEQRGRDFTIYTAFNLEKSPEYWFQLIHKICQKLSDAKINPGYAAVKASTKQTQIISIHGNKAACYGYEQGAPPHDICEGIQSDAIIGQKPNFPWEGSSVTSSSFYQPPSPG